MLAFLGLLLASCGDGDRTLNGYAYQCDGLFGDLPYLSAQAYEAAVALEGNGATNHYLTAEEQKTIGEAVGASLRSKIQDAANEVLSEKTYAVEDPDGIGLKEITIEKAEINDAGWLEMVTGQLKGDAQDTGICPYLIGLDASGQPVCNLGIVNYLSSGWEVFLNVAPKNGMDDALKEDNFVAFQMLDKVKKLTVTTDQNTLKAIDRLKTDMKLTLWSGDLKKPEKTGKKADKPFKDFQSIIVQQLNIEAGYGNSPDDVVALNKDLRENQTIKDALQFVEHLKGMTIKTDDALGVLDGDMFIQDITFDRYFSVTLSVPVKEPDKVVCLAFCDYPEGWTRRIVWLAKAKANANGLATVKIDLVGGAGGTLGDLTMAKAQLFSSIESVETLNEEEYDARMTDLNRRINQMTFNH